MGYQSIFYIFKLSHGRIKFGNPWTMFRSTDIPWMGGGGDIQRRKHNLRGCNKFISDLTEQPPSFLYIEKLTPMEQIPYWRKK